MTEHDWLASSNPAAMLLWLTEASRPRHTFDEDGPDKPSDRKLRLFACACACLDNPTDLQLHKRFFDWVESNQPDSGLSQATLQAGLYLENSATKANLLRDIFGNPFRPVKLPMIYSAHPTMPVSVPQGCPWLTWNNGTIPKLAQELYDERCFDEMPVLADALEEAGCTNEEILRHCRGFQRCSVCCHVPPHDYCSAGCDRGWVKSGPHVRGCWLLDLLLGNQ